VATAVSFGASVSYSIVVIALLIGSSVCAQLNKKLDEIVEALSVL